MAERHDIVLGLKLGEFQRGIATAQADIAKLQQQVTNLAATLGRTIGQIKINVDLSGLTPLNKTLEDLNGTLNKFTGNLTKALTNATKSGGEKTAKEISNIDKTAQAATASVKKLGDQLELAFDKKFLAGQTKVSKALKEIVEAPVKPAGVQGELFTPATLRATKQQFASAEAAANAERKLTELKQKELDKQTKALEASEKKQLALREASARRSRTLFNENMATIFAAQRKFVAEQAANAKKLVEEANRIPRAMANALQNGFSRALGNMAIGDSPIRAILNEVPRAIVSAGAQLTLKPMLADLRELNTASALASQGLSGLGANLNKSGDGFTRFKTTVSNAGGAVGGLPPIFSLATLGAAAMSAAFIGIGAILDRVGDSINALASDLANSSAKMSLATLQLDTVLQDVGRTTGLNVGTMESWTNALRQTQIESGQAVDDLTRISTVFLQLNDTTELSADQLQELVRVTAVLATPVFGGLSKALLSIKGGLSGNLRAIRDNVSVGESQTALTQNYIELLQRQGKTQAEATKIANESTKAQRFLAVFFDRTKGQVDALTKDTDKLVIANQQLKGSFEFLKQQIGRGIEPIYARLVTVLKDVVIAIANINPSVLKSVGTLIGLGGIVVEVGGKMLKWAGIIALVTIAINVLNASLSLTLPLIGGSIAGHLTRLTAMMTGIIPTITGVGSAFKALGSIAISLAKGVNVTSLFTKALAGLGAAIGVVLVFLGKLSLALLANPFTYILLAIPLVIEALKRLNKEFDFLGSKNKELNTGLFETGVAIEATAGHWTLATQAGHAYEIVINALVIAFKTFLLILKGIRLAAFQAEQGINDFLIKFNKFRGAKDAVKALEERSKLLGERIVILSGQYDDLANSIKFNNDQLDENARLLGDGEEAARRKAAQLAKEQENARRQLNLPGRSPKVNDEQQKIIDRLTKSIQDQINAARVRNRELTDGKAAAAQLKLQQEITEAVKEIKDAGTYTEAQEKALRKTLASQLGISNAIETSNEKLEEQRRIFQSILGAAENLKKAFTKQIHDTEESIQAAKVYAATLLEGEGHYDTLNRRADRQAKLEKQRLDLTNQIEEVTARITDLNRVGDKRKLSAPDQKQLRDFEALLKEITRDREVIIELQAKDSDADLEKAQAQAIAGFAQRIKDAAVDEARALEQSNAGLEEFRKNMALGVSFAERQLELRNKENQLQNEINDGERELLRLELEGNPVALEALRIKLEELKVNKETILAIFKQNQGLKEQVEIEKEIKATLESANDAFDKAIEKAKRFEAGISNENIDLNRARIDGLIEQIETYQQKIRQLKRSDPNFVNKETLENINKLSAEIDKLQGQLAEESYIEDIKEFTQVFTQGFVDAIQDGVEGVVKGTQTISEMFRNMASNILLSMAKIMATKAIEGLNGQLLQLAGTISEFQGLRDALNFIGFKVPAKVPGADEKTSARVAADISKGTPATGTEKTVNEAFKATITYFDQIITKFEEAINYWMGRGGTPGGRPFPGDGLFGGGTATTTTQSADDGSDGSEIGDVFSEEFARGMAKATTATQTGLDGLSTTISTGMTSVLNLTNTGFGNLFTSIGNLVMQGIQLISDMMNSQQGGQTGGTGGGGWMDWIQMGVKAVSAYFGYASAAKGGLIAGRPSDKDNTIANVATGEYITNSKAVQFYGKEFMDKINNMSLPKDFLASTASNAATPPMMKGYRAPTMQQSAMPVTNTGMERPIMVTVVDKAHKLDPAAFKMKPSEVTQIFVDGVKKDRVIRKVIREDLSKGGV